MLLKFRFSNFKSFRDEAVLDLRASKISEYDYQIREIGKEKILPVAAVYGANASGKSNVIDAFCFMRKYVINSFIYGDSSNGDNSEFIEKDFPKPRFTPFAFGGQNESKNEKMEFEVWFINNHDAKARIFNYGFSVHKEQVIEEWLFVKAKTAKEYQEVFYRDQETGLECGNRIPKLYKKILPDMLRPECLLVSLGAKLNIEILSIVREWFTKTNVLKNGDSTFDSVFSGTIPPDLFENQRVRKAFVNFISKFDDSIVDFEALVLPSADALNDERSLEIRSVHKASDDSLVSIPFSQESGGTQKMFSLYPYLQEILENGGVLFIDDLNSRLHPLLERLIIQTFIDPELNPNHAQLVFTTHNVWELEDYLLRRDEIWFTEKNKESVSSLYSLFDFEDSEGKKIRKDENYLKNYLIGKYGALPNLKSFDSFGLFEYADNDKVERQ